MNKRGQNMASFWSAFDRFITKSVNKWPLFSTFVGTHSQTVGSEVVGTSPRSWGSGDLADLERSGGSRDLADLGWGLDLGDLWSGVWDPDGSGVILSSPLIYTFTRARGREKTMWDGALHALHYTLHAERRAIGHY